MELIPLQLTLLFAYLLIAPGLSLRCFECNSKDNKDCLSINQDAKAQLVQVCKSETDRNYTLCRKIDMYMDTTFGSEHPPENRVHRACGYMEHPEDINHCYYKSGYNTRSWVCSCDTDDCNSAADLRSPVLLILTIAALLYKST